MTESQWSTTLRQQQYYILTVNMHHMCTCNKTDMDINMKNSYIKNCNRTR